MKKLDYLKADKRTHQSKGRHAWERDREACKGKVLGVIAWEVNFRLLETYCTELWRKGAYVPVLTFVVSLFIIDGSLFTLSVDKSFGPGQVQPVLLRNEDRNSSS